MTYKLLTKEMLPLFFSYAQKEFWDIEETHIYTLLETHPDDFFIVHQEGEIIGFVVALRENDNFGFVSSLLVVEKFRARGFGKKIFHFALHHLGERQIALDSVAGQENFYVKYGFKSYFDVCTYKFTIGSVQAKEFPYEVIKFHKELSLKGQDPYICSIIQNKAVNYRAIQNSNTIRSFAFSFAYKDGYKITLFTEDINETITLFFALCNDYPIGTTIYMQSSKLTPVLEALTEALSMRTVSKLTRMYNKIL